jgi:hypothetical protein
MSDTSLSCQGQVMVCRLLTSVVTLSRCPIGIQHDTLDLEPARPASLCIGTHARSDGELQPVEISDIGFCSRAAAFEKVRQEERVRTREQHEPRPPEHRQ